MPQESFVLSFPNADVLAQNVQGLRDDFAAAIADKGAIGKAAHNAHKTWEKLEHVHFATKEEIRELKELSQELLHEVRALARKSSGRHTSSKKQST